MQLAAFLTSYPGDFATACSAAAASGFTHVDVVARQDRPPQDLEVLADTGLLVSCAALGRGLAPEQVLDAPAVADRRAAVAAVEQQIADAARLGASHVYIVPGIDAGTDALARFAEACGLLAEFARARMIRLCLEHIPGRALPSVATTLDWLERAGPPNCGLLLDVGHCLITNEDPAETIRRGGPRLAYIHLDDNDGVGDLHWPLLTGRLTRETLVNVLAAWAERGDELPLALELNAANPGADDAMRQGKELVERLVRRFEASRS
jgi:sugar phosphate isomerase/epimerase